jgi:hypothetical protein
MNKRPLGFALVGAVLLMLAVLGWLSPLSPVGAASEPAKPRVAANEPKLVSLGSSMLPFEQYFDAAKARTRFVAILSPT